MREPFDEPAVAGEQPRVVDADARSQQFGQRFSEAGAEAEIADLLGYELALGLRRQVDRKQGLRLADGLLL